MSDPTPAPKPAQDKKPVPPKTAIASDAAAADAEHFAKVRSTEARSRFGEGIPVAEVKWTTHIPLPGKTMNDDFIATKNEPNGKAWTVEYLPQMRHFRIVHVDPAAKKREQVRYVHEVHAKVWEPAS